MSFAANVLADPDLQPCVERGACERSFRQWLMYGAVATLFLVTFWIAERASGVSTRSAAGIGFALGWLSGVGLLAIVLPHLR